MRKLSPESVMDGIVATLTATARRTRLTRLAVIAAIFAFANDCAGSEEDFWHVARPVWSRNDENKENCARVFEGKFVCDGQTVPVLRIASSYPFRIELNGEFAGYGPARAPKGVFRVDEWPLKEVHSGVNTLRIFSLAHNTPTYQWMKQPAFVQCEIVAGGKVLLASDSMTCRPFDAYIDTKTRYSFQRGWEERYECRRLINSADTRLALEVVKCGTPKYIVRGIPYPRFEIATPQLTAKDANLTRYDMGLDNTGFIKLDIHAATTGVVQVVWDEILTKGKVDLNRARTKSELIVEITEPGDYKIETLEPYTGRYFELTEPDGIETTLSLREYKYPLCGAQTNDKIFAAARETFAQNAADCLTDCPGRERAGWLCDSFFTGRAEQFLTHSNLVERAFLENYALAEDFPALPDGMVAMCFPADHTRVKGTNPRNFIPNWAMWLVLHTDDYVRRTGDREIAEMLRPRLEGIERYFRVFENSDGLLENLRGWIFVEWSRANKLVRGVNYPTNMLYAEMLDALARLYGKEELLAKAGTLREKIREKSFDGTFFRDQNLSDEATETCQYYAFFTHTATCESHPELWRRLVEDFGPMRDMKKSWPQIAKSNAFIGNFLRYELLYRAGLYERLRREAERYFAKMAEMTGTLWEHSQPTASCCHGFASYAAVLLASPHGKGVEK